MQITPNKDKSLARSSSVEVGVDYVITRTAALSLFCLGSRTTFITYETFATQRKCVSANKRSKPFQERRRHPFANHLFPKRPQVYIPI